MKLLLQRTLSSRLEGPFWVEEARLEQGSLRGFLTRQKDLATASFVEPRFDKNLKLHYICEREGVRQVYQHDHADPLTARDTFKFDFDRDGQLISLQAENPSAPYGLCLGSSGPIRHLDSSLTHLQYSPTQDLWWITSLTKLYRGTLDDLQEVGPAPSKRFTLGLEGLLYCQRNNLWQQPYGEAQPQKIFSVEPGNLVFAHYTPQGTFVFQEDCDPCRLLLISPQGEAQVLWSGSHERVYVCDAHSQGGQN